MLLNLHDLDAGYGAKTVISGVSLALEPGQILALLGHNGAGKTTTLKAIMGLLPARAGSVHFDGHPINRLGLARSFPVRSASVRDDGECLSSEAEASDASAAPGESLPARGGAFASCVAAAL